MDYHPVYAIFTLSQIIFFVVIVGLQIAAQLIFRKPQQEQRQQQQNLAPPPNGTFNERQAIPTRRAGFGFYRTGGDYVTLEEKAGVAYHVIAHASHRIEGFSRHWLHDELVELDADGYVISPDHFAKKVRIETRLGKNAETAWDALKTARPSIWTEDHRGDGVSQILMTVWSVSSESFSTTFPQGMPEHTSLDKGAPIYDPRDPEQDMDDPETWKFSRNLALGYLFFVCHPSGLKRKLSEMIMSDWIRAADVCDQTIINRDDQEEPRYWGGHTWKHEAKGTDPVSIGMKIAEAGDMVLYNDGDGKVGVHPGEMVLPTVRVTEEDIVDFSYDINQSPSNTVLGVRGRYIEPRNSWLYTDAAIVGDPYVGGDDSSQRTSTVDNEVIQSHNHIQRIQKLRFIRENAPTVSVKVAFRDEVADILFSRFVRVHLPPQLDEAIVELDGGASLNLSPDDFSISFSGMVVPENLYDFDAATEEGVPGGTVGPVEATGVPVPEGFAIELKSESLASGATFAYVNAKWTHYEDTFVHELQYQLKDESQHPRSVLSNAGEDEVRTPSLEAGTEYRFRLRAWSAGAPSPWTEYLYSDTDGGSGGAPPEEPTDLAVSFGDSDTDPSHYEVRWTNPSSSSLDSTVVYASMGGFDVASVIHTDRSGPGVGVAFETNPNWPIPYAGAVYNVWIRSFNKSGIGSDLVGPIQTPEILP